MSEADADHHRYRALLRDADDEPKRLALIQLLIDEGARDGLAARRKPSKPEPLPEYQRFAAFTAPLPAQRGMTPHEVAGPAARPWPYETNLSAAADDAPIDDTDLAARPGIFEPEPPTPPSQPLAPEPHDGPTEPTPQKIMATLEKVTIGPVTSIPLDLSRPDDLADRVARALSGLAASANAGPVAPMASSSGTPPAASDVEIAARIEAALTELTRVHGPQEDVDQLGGGEARLSLRPAPAPSETAIPDAMRSVPAIRTATHDLIERFVRLLGKRLVPPAAAIPSAAVTPPSDDEEENSIVLQIQAALAKQKRDG